VSQGFVLAPLLLSIYVYDIFSGFNQSYLADGILILARSVMGLQKLLDIAQAELSWLDLRLYTMTNQ
jgi:hypothetical protein